MVNVRDRFIAVRRLCRESISGSVFGIVSVMMHHSPNVNLLIRVLSALSL